MAKCPRTWLWTPARPLGQEGHSLSPLSLSFSLGSCASQESSCRLSASLGRCGFLAPPLDRPCILAPPHIHTHAYIHVHNMCNTLLCIHMHTLVWKCIHTPVRACSQACNAHRYSYNTHMCRLVSTQAHICPQAAWWMPGPRGTWALFTALFRSSKKGPKGPVGSCGCCPLSPVGGRGCPGEIIWTQGGGPGSHGLLDGGLLAVGLEQRGGAIGQHGPLISAELGPAVLKPDLEVGKPC